MKVIEFIKKLNEIGFDENTTLSFSCVNGDIGEWYDLEPDFESSEDNGPFVYGEELDGEPYDKKCIDFCLNVDGCEDYVKDKIYSTKMGIKEELLDVLNKY